MKHLIKKAENNVYTFESNYVMNVESYCQETGEEDAYEEDYSKFDEDELNAFMQSEDVEYLNEVIRDDFDFATGISMKLENGKLISIVTTNRNLSDQEIEKLKHWIEGQCSDGFGEGLEQHEFTYDIERDTYEVEEYDEEEERSYTHEEPCETRISYYIKLWPDNFKIDLIK